MENRYNASTSELEKFPPRIIIKFRDSVNIPPYKDSDDITAYLSKNNILPWEQLVEKFPGVTIVRSFTSVEPEILSEIVKIAQKNTYSKYQPPNFFCYCTIDCSYDNYEENLLTMLLKNKSVEYAYFESEPVEAPGVVSGAPVLGITGNNIRTNEQGYLDGGGIGINARFALKQRGGLGENVKFIDIEQGWHLDHNDLKAEKEIRLLWGKENPMWKQHGCSTLGIILMQDNAIGGIGIAPLVKANVISQISQTGHHTIHNAIMKAIEHLDPGDVLLLEAQMTDRSTDNKLWPVEIKPIIFHSIELAVAYGITVIEPAGNGRTGEDPEGNNLDEFPTWYGKNIFGTINEETFRDSGAILVGAASSNEAHGKIRSSNFGSRVDCFAWGEGVFTTAIPAEEYDPDFKSTSSAAAIIAGAAISVQSIRKGKGRPPLDPIALRKILREKSYGTGSRNNIGSMPDLEKIFPNI